MLGFSLLLLTHSAHSDFFHSVFNSCRTDVAVADLPYPDNSLCSVTIAEEDTYAVLSSLNPTKAMGGDGIPPVVLKRCAVALTEPVHHLFSQCLSKSYLHKEWRNHDITPIPKSKDKSSVFNYHPISLLSCISKALERLVFDKISDFVFQNCISHCQFSFVRNRSSLQQLLQYLDFYILPLITASKLIQFIWIYERLSTPSLSVKSLLNCGLVVLLAACGTSSSAISQTGSNVSLSMVRHLVCFLLPLVCLRAVFWDRYCLLFTSMIFLQPLISQFHIYLLMTLNAVKPLCHSMTPRPFKLILTTSVSGVRRMTCHLMLQNPVSYVSVIELGMSPYLITPSMVLTSPPLRITLEILVLFSHQTFRGQSTTIH